MDGTHPRTPHAIRRAADPAAGNGPHRRAARGAFPVSPSSFVARADCEATVIRANLARRCVVFILCDGGLRPWAMMLLGFAGLGFVSYRQTRRAKLQAA
jgi:hypothetical protein